MSNLSLTYSFWWLFVCVIIGGIYAWIQYSKKAPWSSRLNIGLAGMRWILVTIISFLLLEPFINNSINQFQKPLFIMAVDNSTSVASSKSGVETELIQQLKQVKLALDKQGFDVAVVDLKGKEVLSIDSISFNYNTTDLSNQLNRIKRDYDNYNVGGMVLFTDGIFNKGYSPLAIPSKYPMFTVGLGDTTKVKDLAVTQVIHNATVFEGNSLMLEIHSINTGYKNISTQLIVKSKGEKTITKDVVFTEGQLLQKTIVAIPITGSGKQSLQVELVPTADEYTSINNHQTIYFDVINAQKKILIIASAPHPDIKAIKTSIEKNEYYKVELAYELPNTLDYDLVIAHQYPDANTKSQDKEKLANTIGAKWFILSEENDLSYLQHEFGFSGNTNGGTTSDLVKPLMNVNFDGFSMSDGFLPWLTNLPPISTPYGLLLNNRMLKVMLTQQIGSVVTEKPLLFFTKQKESSIGFLVGTNSWLWKLDEYRLSQSHQYFNELISKTVQYLSADQRKKRLYVAPQKNTYEKGEDVVFDIQEYDALFNQITGSKVDIEITGENGYTQKKSYMPLSINSVYKLRGLAQGVYNYSAKTQLENKSYIAKGQFIIKLLDLEKLNPTADFNILQKLATKSNGEFYTFAQIENLKNKVAELSPISTIHTTQKEEPLLNLKWFLGLLLLIATAEWFLRKFHGGY